MKLGIFTDSHYSTEKITCNKRYNSESLQKIREAFEYFQMQNCDLVICLGDLIDREKEHEQEIINLHKVADLIKEYRLEIVVIMGNHDAFSFEKDEFYGILGENCRPVNCCIEGKSLLFIDACYFKSGKHYGPGDKDWTDTFYPDSTKLQQDLSEVKDEAYLFMHQNIDPILPENHKLFNAKELFDIIEQSKKVRAVYQGHYHPGKSSEYNGIEYITYPAMCENHNAYYIVEK